MRASKVVLVAAVVCVNLARGVSAQTTPDAQVGAVELALGGAQFIDDGAISHTLVGGSGRWYLTRRVAVGPEIVYMVGPGDDRDLFVTGNLTFDLRGPTTSQPKVVPYLVAGGGLFQHRDRFGSASFSSNEGAFTAGGGARVWLSRRVYVAGEVRAGWEPHLSYGGRVGVGF